MEKLQFNPDLDKKIIELIKQNGINSDTPFNLLEIIFNRFIRSCDDSDVNLLIDRNIINKGTKTLKDEAWPVIKKLIMQANKE